MVGPSSQFILLPFLRVSQCYLVLDLLTVPAYYMSLTANVICDCRLVSNLCHPCLFCSLKMTHRPGTNANRMHIVTTS